MAGSKGWAEQLARVPLFSACAKKELDTLARQAQEAHFEAGERLVHEGDVGREFYLVLDGVAEMSLRGRRLGTMGPGDYVGDLALIDKLPRPATVTAIVPVTTLVLAHKDFDGVLAGAPALAHKLLVGLARRVSELEGRA